MKFNEKGEELPDPTPVAVTAPFKPAESMQQMIARLVSREVSAAAARHGFETVDEANDFDVEDEEFPETKYEVLGDERLEESHRSIVDSRAARAALERAKNRGARRNGRRPGEAPSTKPDGGQHQPPGSGRDDRGLRGSPGDQHLAGSQDPAGGSAQTHDGRPTRIGGSR